MAEWWVGPHLSCPSLRISSPTRGAHRAEAPQTRGICSQKETSGLKEHEHPRGAPRMAAGSVICEHTPTRGAGPHPMTRATPRVVSITVLAEKSHSGGVDADQPRPVTGRPPLPGGPERANCTAAPTPSAEAPEEPDQGHCHGGGCQGRSWARGRCRPWKHSRHSRPSLGHDSMSLGCLWLGSEFEGLSAEVGWGTREASRRARWF